MSNVSVFVDVEPTPKPRQTQRDKWAERPCVLRYRAFADKMREEAFAQAFTLPEAGAVFEFGIGMPRSWSAKKRVEMLDKPHQQKPDIDNLVKACMDALAKEDCAIWHIAGAEKRWSVRGFVQITAGPPIEMGRGV